MKREMELVRKILLAVENKPNEDLDSIRINGYSDETVNYHITIMNQANLLDAFDSHYKDRHYWSVHSLTWDGHEFLDAVRSDTVWEKAKELALKTAGMVSLEALKAAIPIVLKSLIS